MFPPTFLYTQSWEDPEPDMRVFAPMGPQDTVLTLTSGGCNALNLLINGAGHVRRPSWLRTPAALPACRAGTGL
jgi:betaine lipid synthase